MELSPSSNIKISQDDSKLHLRLKSDKNFSVLDENELFEEMGLTQTTDEELRQIMPKEIIQYLGSSVLVQTHIASPLTGETKSQSAVSPFVKNLSNPFPSVDFKSPKPSLYSDIV